LYATSRRVGGKFLRFGISELKARSGYLSSAGKLSRMSAYEVKIGEVALRCTIGLNDEAECEVMSVIAAGSSDILLLRMLRLKFANN
jgi:hypothetical protein